MIFTLKAFSHNIVKIFAPSYPVSFPLPIPHFVASEQSQIIGDTVEVFWDKQVRSGNDTS